MNKKYFLGMFAAAGMLLVTSCSNDELIEQGSGDMATVSFSLTTEGAPMSRAISDGKSADKLVYAVFDKEGTRISGIQRVTKTDVTFPVTESLSLAKGQTYKVAFWAQNKDCNAYTVGENMKVTVGYDYASNNDDTRDAFFKTVEFTVNGDASIDVELKRPFAQINVGVTEEDYQKAKDSGVEIEKSAVVIKNAATTINLLDGSVSEPTEVSYGLATVPAKSDTPEDLMVDYDNDGTKESYKWLSMCYILVDDESSEAIDGVYGANKTTLDKLAFEFQTADGKSIKFEEGLNGVPVQRNYRTNIVGRILTGSIDFNISIDDEFEDDHNYPDGSIGQQLEFAAKFGGTVTLSENATLDKPIKVTKNMVINLNGKTLTYEATETGVQHMFVVADGASLVINGENGKIETINNSAGRSADCYVANVRRGSTLTVNGGEYEADDCTLFQSDGGKIYIKDGSFKITRTDWGYNYTLNVIDTYINSSEIAVSGGRFYMFDPANNKADGPNTTYIAEGYKTIQNGDWYYVVPEDVDAVATIASKLATALTANKENIVVVLGADIDLPITLLGSQTPGSGEYKLGGADTKNITIDLNGQKLNITTDY